MALGRASPAPHLRTTCWGQPEQTAAVMTDGWYRTGDIGHLDADGYLSNTGRKKDILVTASGKNVQPAGLEDSIRPDALAQEVVVVGDDRPFIAALIALDEAMLPGWMKVRRRVVIEHFEDLVTDIYRTT